MDLLRLSAGLALIAFGVLAQMFTSRRMAGWPFASRLRVVAVPVISLIIFFVVAWTNEGLGTWWVVPFGFAGAGLLDLTAFRVVTHVESRV